MTREITVYLDDQLKIYEAHLKDRSDAGSIDQQAEVSALLAEAYAKGTHNGTPVSSSEAGYHDNAKYYMEQTRDLFAHTIGLVVDGNETLSLAIN